MRAVKPYIVSKSYKRQNIRNISVLFIIVAVIIISFFFPSKYYLNEAVLKIKIVKSRSEIQILKFIDKLKITTNKNAPKETASVEMRQKPRVAYRKFLIINDKRIGFGAGGINIENKYYPSGTVFEVVKDDGQYITVNLEGRQATFEKNYFSGSYGSAGNVAKYKWDLTNNRPTGLDLEDQAFHKYYHLIILAIYRYFWQFLLLVILLSIASYFLMKTLQKENARFFIAILFSLFLLGGGCQGHDYYNYLERFDKVVKMQGDNLGGFQIGSATIGQLEIDHSFGYSFWNILYVPIFLATHIAVGYFLYFAGPFIPKFLRQTYETAKQLHKK